MDDLKKGRGKEDVDKSMVLVLYAVESYFSSPNCVRELLRSDEPLEPSEIYSPIHDCKGQAPLFGFELTGQIAGDLCMILRACNGRLDASCRSVVTRYVDAILYCLERTISGRGGDAGKALRRKLAA